jgi:hypothetical protein
VYRLQYQGGTNQRARNNISSNQQLKFLAIVNVIPGLLPLSTLMMEVVRSSEMLVPTRATPRHIPEDGIPHSHRSEILKSYIELTGWII